jgi:hypothetical protein
MEANMTKSTLCIVLLAIVPALASASQWDIQQLADELEHASNNLYRSAKAVRGFSSVGHNANRLSNKAEQLAKSIGRNRTSAYVRTRFNDVSRYYQRVENAFLSARRSYGTHYVDESFDYVADLFASLNYEFNGDYRFGGYNSNSQYFNRNNYDRGSSYISPLILINPSRYDRQRNPRPSVIQRNNRHHDDYDHKSPVVQRQNQRNRNDRRADQNRRDNDPADSRGDRGRNDRNRNSDQSDQGSRGRNNDTGATNQNRNGSDRAGANRTSQGRDNSVMQRLSQRADELNADANRSNQTRFRAPSSEDRTSAVTQRQNQRGNNRSADTILSFSGRINAVMVALGELV